METKKCSTCGKTKTLSEFSKAYTARCKECVAKLERNKRKQNKTNKEELVVLQEKMRMATEISIAILANRDSQYKTIPDNLATEVAELTNKLYKELNNE